MKRILLVFMLLLLAACGSLPQGANVAQKVTYVLPPDGILTPCKMYIMLPNLSTFTPADENNALTDYSVKITGEYSKCAATVQSIIDWKATTQQNVK